VTGPVVLVVNPTKVDDFAQLQATVSEQCARRGLPEPVVLETTESDTGAGAAHDAVRRGAQLVLVAGGDGTVQAVCGGLAGSGVVLGILPLGTGNLLARNLDLPLELDPALAVALGGRERRLDLATASIGDRDPVHFAVMAGVGFDAEMMVDAPAGLKALVGWPAYVVSGLQHLRDRPSQLTIAFDGRSPKPFTARGVVIGNVGELQAGVGLLPDAVPDDGVLDVVVLAPRHLLDWGRLLARLVGRSRTDDGNLHRHSARRIEVRADSPLQAQLDGEPVGQTTSLTVEVAPAALYLRVPR